MKNGLARVENRERFTAFSTTGETDSELFRYNIWKGWVKQMKIGDYVSMEKVINQTEHKWVVLSPLTYDENDYHEKRH